MRTVRRALWIVAGLLIGCATAAGQAPPASEDCLSCHVEPEMTRANGSSVSVDVSSFAASAHAPLACVDCHSDLATLTEYPHADALKKVDCAICHVDVGATYSDSIHARARERSGLTVAPACVNCHGSHDILNAAEPKSRVAPTQVPATCGTCHGGITERYGRSVHAAALRKGGAPAPSCATCHTAHAIQRVDTSAARLGAIAECGSCHTAIVASFARTFHGKVTQLGSTSVASCTDCHNSHEILPKSDPASAVSRRNLQATCGTCHAGASARFVEYDPHPNPEDYERSAALWWANRFYWVLIPGCFGFFGLHSLLWFWRSTLDARARGRAPR